MKKAETGFLILFMLIHILIAAETVSAETATSNLTVSASVTSTCRITSIGNIDFGTYDPLSESPTDAAGSVVFRCVKGTSYKTYITGTRTMSGGSESLDFELYNEAGRTTVFAGDNSVSATTAQNFNAITTDIYGRIEAGKDVSAASYTATLITVVEY